MQKEIAEMLSEVSLGNEFLWLIRFDAVLVKEDGLWNSHQVHFSHPALQLPDLCILINKYNKE